MSQALTQIKKLALAMIACAITSNLNAMNQHTIPIAINNIKHERGGQLIVFVFLEEGFPKRHEQAIHKAIAPVEASSSQVDIQVPSAQVFAIKVLHDENMDGKVTKNWTGIIPHDGLGFSNGARIRFAAPKFKQAQIHYSPELAPNITLQYF